MSQSYKDSLNLPRTEFPIRAHAKEKEAELLARWKRDQLDASVVEKNKGKDAFFLHDGPPYANGHIHIGTAFNKILKDIITKSQRMEGRYVPLTPGWDCHGLPIELKVTSELGIERDKKNIDVPRLKKACRAYAQKWIDIQREEFKQLGALADWENPYVTMAPGYEAEILYALAQFVRDGFIERKGKTVPWCASCQTVLAAAEIEYHERKDPSIYIHFPLDVFSAKKLFSHVLSQHPDLDLGFLVWTTTPWTIPLNRGVVLHPSASYVLLKGHDNKAHIVAKDVAEHISSLLGIDGEVLAEIPSTAFNEVHARHPFIPKLKVPVLRDNHVTLTEGTACMHMAPGCGPEDYLIAVRENIGIFSPLNPDGTYGEGIAPAELEGMPISEGQIWVIKKLAEGGNLVHKESIRHAYPHCWRCRQGLMFRATNQWFCNLQNHDLLKRALEEAKDISFIPKTGRARLSATIGSRSEWCISRQRYWGVPIPALICTHCDTAWTSDHFVTCVGKHVAREGIEFWDTVTVEELVAQDMLPASFACSSCGAAELDSFKKETDILDVWFDAGVSHTAVSHLFPQMTLPVDMYLEGSDQHRGWFQSSLLSSMVLNGKAPMRTIATHGYVVDCDGRKMSKSLGNVTAPRDIIEKYSADILRLWVCSSNYETDMVISDAVLKNTAEVYRKIRNTARFMLANLYDFSIARDAVPYDDMHLIDTHALSRLYELYRDVRYAYASFDTPEVFHLISNYVTKDLSALYLDIIKDRLYVECADGTARRSAQTVCWYILDTLTKLIAPVLSFLAEELSDQYQPGKTHSIHLDDFPVLSEEWLEKFDTIRETWNDVMAMREVVLKALEEARAQGEIKHSLDAAVTIAFDTNDQHGKRVAALVERELPTFLNELFIVSQVTISTDMARMPRGDVSWVAVSVAHAAGQKCSRCWQWHTGTQELCSRCSALV